VGSSRGNGFVASIERGSLREVARMGRLCASISKIFFVVKSGASSLLDPKSPMRERGADKFLLSLLLFFDQKQTQKPQEARTRLRRSR